MPVYRKVDGDRAEIWVPTNANWNSGFFLLFLGAVAAAPLPYLLEAAGYAGPPFSFVGMLGFVLAAVGLFLMRFSRKRFVVEPKQVMIKDGFFGRPVAYRWEGEPLIRLRSQEEERSGKVSDYWLVNLVDGKRQYVLDRRSGHQMESRSLAEALAKAINCPVLERGDDGELTIPREELDLPFRERVKLHPNLLGQEVAKPENCPVELEQEAGKQRYRWRLLSPAVMNELFSLAFVIVLLGFVPIFRGAPSEDHPDQPGEKFQRSYFDLARQEGKFTYFLVSGSFLAALSFYVFGYRKELTASPERLEACDRLWGVPVWQAAIPSDKLEEVWVRQSSRGAQLEFISDDCIISGRTSSVDVASWVAAQIRRFYAA